MPKKDKSNEVSQEPQQDNQQDIKDSFTKSDYIRAKAIISSYREAQKNKPKRKCSEKQLAALAAGRAKNTRNKPKVE